MLRPLESGSRPDNSSNSAELERRSCDYRSELIIIRVYYGYRYPYSHLGANKTQVFVLVENAMVDGAATSALHATSMGPAVTWAQRMTRTLPSRYPLLLRWPRGHSLAPLPTLAAMWGVVEV